tara:strand:- start:905 stop:1291 length:387 start_codon:yes stop_codon:yes gene_type:complete
MVKLKVPTTNVESRRSTVRLPTAMIPRIALDMEKSGFNKKQQSKWLNQALNELFNIPDYTDLIAEEFISAGTTKPITISLPIVTEKKIIDATKAVLDIEKIEKDKSAVIRVAIIQRLLKTEGKALRMD